MNIDHGTDKHPEHHRADVRTTNSAADPTAVDTLAYPISPDYVKSWTLICVCQAVSLVKSRTSVQASKARVPWGRRKSSSAEPRRPANTQHHRHLQVHAGGRQMAAAELAEVRAELAWAISYR